MLGFVPLKFRFITRISFVLFSLLFKLGLKIVITFFNSHRFPLSGELITVTSQNSLVMHWDLIVILSLKNCFIFISDFINSKKVVLI